ncbi:DNA-directed RNA polymerase, omega subunit [Leadbettera azotonutricia ZAS-9]|uniref:DNA-directed RNA polymerase subunit omega n=2 Tax=Leadbettera azotonutricia TaxID=150829 RepID=F5YEY7_LEAAZ|nr:DNA-directed RNA polymerase, omega subunit [Leadbettera azotonutricia ZAS-9]
MGGVKMAIGASVSCYFTQFSKKYIVIDMIFPLEELIEYDKNMYEITSAASRRSYQLSMLKDPEIGENDGKVVSLAARQVFTDEIQFRLSDE